MAAKMAWPAASVRERLDRAFRRVGLNLEPSLVSVTRNGPDRIAPPSMPIADAEHLAALLESMPEAVTRW